MELAWIKVAEDECDRVCSVSSILFLPAFSPPESLLTLSRSHSLFLLLGIGGNESERSRGTGKGERESGNECTAVTRLRIQNGGQKKRKGSKRNSLSKPYTCQLSLLRRESRAYRLKTSISRQLTLAGQFLTPD